jgi:tRNA(fMet)-specific endonuclease VapC
VTFLLDTDTVSYALRGSGGVAGRILELKPSDLAISSITLSELIFGAQRRQSKKLLGLIDGFVHDIEVLPFDERAARVFGKLAAQLADRGRPIGTNDAMIAGHALALGRTLVSNNLRHFKYVHGLQVETWVQSDDQ